MTVNDAVAVFRRFGVDPKTSTDLAVDRKRLLRQHHPDSGGSDADAAMINAAYDLLKDHTWAAEPASPAPRGGFDLRAPRGGGINLRSPGRGPIDVTNPASVQSMRGRYW